MNSSNQQLVKKKTISYSKHKIYIPIENLILHRCNVSWRPSKIACVADTLHLYRPGRTISMASNDRAQGPPATQASWKAKVKGLLKQRAHIDQTIAWPVPHACAQPYHLGSGSYGQSVHRLPWLIGAHRHGCLCPGDMVVRMREILARLWVGVCMPLALSLS